MSLKFVYLVKNDFDFESCEFLRTTRNLESVSANLFDSNKITREQQEDWFSKSYSLNRDFMIWIVWEDDKRVGYVQYHVESIKHHRCEIGFVVHPDYQSRGLGTEIVKWSLKNFYNINAFDAHIRRVWLTVFPENETAIQLYQKHGFKTEGIMRSFVYNDNKYRDVIIMSLLI